MKRIINILKEYPLAAVLSALADFFITYRYCSNIVNGTPVEIEYFIALYGSIMGMLILSAGWIRASSKAEKKEAERRRAARRSAVYSMYRREFYGITEN